MFNVQQVHFGNLKISALMQIWKSAYIFVFTQT